MSISYKYAKMLVGLRFQFSVAIPQMATGLIKARLSTAASSTSNNVRGSKKVNCFCFFFLFLRAWGGCITKWLGHTRTHGHTHPILRHAPHTHTHTHRARETGWGGGPWEFETEAQKVYPEFWWLLHNRGRQRAMADNHLLTFITSVRVCVGVRVRARARSYNTRVSVLILTNAEGDKTTTIVFTALLTYLSRVSRWASLTLCVSAGGPFARTQNPIMPTQPANFFFLKFTQCVCLRPLDGGARGVAKKLCHSGLKGPDGGGGERRK